MDFQGILRRQVKEVKERIQSLTGEVVSTTTLLLFFLLMPQLVPKLMAATKEEIKIRLDAKDNMQPGQKDSILYTGTAPRSLTHADDNQNDGQNTTIYVNNLPINFNDSRTVEQNYWVKISGDGPGGAGIDDFYAGSDWGDVGSSGPLAIKPTFGFEDFDEITRTPTFKITIANPQNSDVVYVTRYDPVSGERIKASKEYPVIDEKTGLLNDEFFITGDPLPNNVYGTHFFRLEEREKNGGKINIYKVEPVRVPRGGEVIYGPNPALDHCTIDYGPEMQGTIQVFNMYGEIVARYPYTGGPFRIDTNTFESGLYGIEVLDQSTETPIDGTLTRISVVH